MFTFTHRSRSREFGLDLAVDSKSEITAVQILVSVRSPDGFITTHDLREVIKPVPFDLRVWGESWRSGKPGSSSPGDQKGAVYSQSSFPLREDQIHPGKDWKRSGKPFKKTSGPEQALAIRSHSSGKFAKGPVLPEISRENARPNPRRWEKVVEKSHSDGLRNFRNLPVKTGGLKDSGNFKNPWYAIAPQRYVRFQSKERPEEKSSSSGSTDEAKRSNEIGSRVLISGKPRNKKRSNSKKSFSKEKANHEGDPSKIAPARPLNSRSFRSSGNRQVSRIEGIPGIRKTVEPKSSVPNEKEAKKEVDPKDSDGWKVPKKKNISWWKRDSPIRDPRVIAPASLRKSEDAKGSNVKKGNSDSNGITQLLGGGVPTVAKRLKAIRLKVENKKDPNGKDIIILRSVYPTKELMQCHVPDCETAMACGYCKEDNRNLRNHIMRTHNIKPEWSYTCGICGEETEEVEVKATHWIKRHVASHGVEVSHLYKTGKSVKEKAAEELERTAPSLSNPRRKTKALDMTSRQMTPEKLECMIQTRSVVKSLSILKESVKKEEEKSKDVGKGEKPIAPKQQSKLSGFFKPRPSINLAKVATPSGRLSISPEEQKKIDAERRANARKSFATQSRMSIQGRLSLQPVKTKAKDPEETKDDMDDTFEIVEKEKTPEVTIDADSICESDNDDNELSRTFVMEHWEPVVRKMNTWCLDHESTKDAWLGDEVIQWYLKWLCSSHKNFEVIDPIWWEMYMVHGIERIHQKLCSNYTYFFPVCNEEHWILLIFNSDSIWYANSAAYEPRGKVEKFIQELGRNRQWFDVPVPLQKDTVNCGVHVCLIARSFATGSFWYDESDIQSFRSNIKKMLRERMYELYSEPPKQFIPKSPSSGETEDSDQSDIVIITTEEPKSEEIPEKVVLRNAATSEDVEKKEEKVSEPILPLMDIVLSPPPVPSQKVLPHQVPIQKLPRAKAKCQKGNKKKVPNGKPEDLVKKVRLWFQREFKSYVEDGKSFQRLEWITSVLTAAIQKASAGDEQIVEKIWKRCPPPEVQEGEMSTQTVVKKSQSSARRDEKSSGQGDAQSLIKSYGDNRSKTFNKIIGKEAKQCDIPIAELEKFFTKTTSVTNVPKEVLDKVTSRLPNVEVGKWIEDAFTEKEVISAFKKTKDTAPGVDGLRYHHLTWFDPECTMLTQIYNECRSHRKIPSHWKEAETILLYKGGDEMKPDNWRPISLMPTIYKLYSSLWNRRIRSVDGIMSKCQRGFQEREGCNESIGILRTAIDVAKGERKHLSVAWLDLTNAFGSVPHELIESTLVAYGFPDTVVHVIKDMYKNASIRVKSRTDKTDQIQIKSGVKQGDPISPTLFNMCLENIIRKHLKDSSGHRCLSTSIKLLAFADDMAILAESKEQLQRELTAMDLDCTPLNLIFKPAKCASLVIEFGKVRKEAKLKLKSQSIRNLAEQDTYKYLGVQTGVESRISEMDLMKKVTEELDTINKCCLTPPQKLDCLKTFVLPKMTYMYGNSIPKLTELTVFANMVMRGVKIIHSIPVKGSPLEYVNLPVGKGGLGVSCPRITAMTTFLVSTLKKLWSQDEYIRRLYREYLTVVVQKETGKEKDAIQVSDIAAYLSNEIPSNKKAFGFNCFTRIREVLRGMSQNQDAPLHKMRFVEKNGNLALMIQATETSKKKIFTEFDVKRMQQLVKGEVIAAQLNRFLTEKTVKSEVVQVIQQHPPSNSFVRTGGKVSLACHRFIHRARLNLLSCNNNTFDKSKSKSCRRCGYPTESQGHILQNCTYGMAKLISARHDAVLYKVKKMIEAGDKKEWKMRIDQEIPGYTRLRPDIYLESPDKKEVLIADVSCPYEHGIKAMQASWDRKVEKYEEGFQHLRDQGVKFTVLPIIVGSLGTWWTTTSKSLEELGIPKSVIRNVIPELCSTVLEHSKNVYWNHIFGDSYTVVPVRYGYEKPIGNQWKKENNTLQKPLTH